MEFLEMAKKRFSVRKYLTQPVEDDKLALILEAGRVAPTAANRQPQELIVVRSAEAQAKLKKAANTYGAPLAIIVCGNRATVWKRPFDGKLHHDVDASIVTDHMMMEATELGLGSLWICYFNPELLKSEFNIPDDIEPVNILAIGYAAPDATPTERHSSRKPLTETVHYETY
jgi:nitroreductase